MKLSIILVNWNCYEVIFDCIDSILNANLTFPYEIIVVDNNSEDGSREILEKKYSSVRLLKNSFNNLFAGANNQGFSISEGENILILNTDTIVNREAIEKMLDYVDGRNDKIATCKLLNPDGTTQYYMHRKFPSFFRLIPALAHKRFTWFAPSFLKNFLYLDNNFEKDFFVEQAAGACMMMNRKVIEYNGLFDEKNFPLYYNDVDFCYRLSKKGMKIKCFCDVSIIHLKGVSVRKLKFSKGGVEYARSSLLYFRIHRMYLDYFLLKFLYIILFSLVAVQASFLFLMRIINKKEFIARLFIFQLLKI